MDYNKTPVCRFLRAKNSFGMLEGGEYWSGIEDPNASYWCNKTAGPVGPDNQFASSRNCIEKRGCFQVPVKD